MEKIIQTLNYSAYLKKSMLRKISKITRKNLLRKGNEIIDRLRGLDFHIEWAEVGLYTEKRHTARELGLTSPSGDKYLVDLLNDLNVTEKDCIIDIGSGKGSAMRAMLEFPFSRVDGVEITERFAEIAIRNFKILNAKTAHVFNCDATKFQQYDRYNILYFFNPFPPRIMSEVVSNILQSIQGKDNEILIIYNNPTSHDLIINQGVFSKIREYPDKRGDKIYIYSNKKPEHSRLHQ